SPRKTRIDLIARQTDNRLRVSVIDQGVGMSKDAIAEATRRRAYAELPADFLAAGHGFGLAVAVDIIDMHGGSVEFESQQDWGTTI
ncbi:ATP-binding protein, partial [Citrobacter sp. AAK_AS5]